MDRDVSHGRRGEARRHRDLRHPVLRDAGTDRSSRPQEQRQGRWRRRLRPGRSDRHGRKAGFTIAETRELVRGISRRTTPGPHLPVMARRKLVEADTRIAEAKRMRAVLERTTASECPSFEGCTRRSGRDVPAHGRASRGTSSLSPKPNGGGQAERDGRSRPRLVEPRERSRKRHVSSATPAAGRTQQSTRAPSEPTTQRKPDSSRGRVDAVSSPRNPARRSESGSSPLNLELERAVRLAQRTPRRDSRTARMRRTCRPSCASRRRQRIGATPRSPAADAHAASRGTARAARLDGRRALRRTDCRWIGHREPPLGPRQPSG